MFFQLGNSGCCLPCMSVCLSVQPGKTLPQGATILKLVTSQAGAGAAAAGKPATVLGAGTAGVAASAATPQQLQACVTAVVSWVDTT